MDLENLTYTGPALERDLLQGLPDSLRALLEQINGFILFGGALHVRGACHMPKWHSLIEAWRGETAFHHIYPSVKPAWIPFAEDCVGDQFFLVEETIVRLEAETGEIHSTAKTLHDFLESAVADPIETLSTEPLIRFRQEKGDLPEGHLILAYPPFCTEEARAGVSLAAISAREVHVFHADLARQLQGVGDKIEIKFSG